MFTQEGNIINRSTSSSAAYSIYFDWAGRNKLVVIPAVEMENAVSLSVKTEIDVHEGNTWYDAK